MILKTAFFSPCRRYRYSLSRYWKPGETVLFIGLNPSTADEKNDDPTIRRCIRYATDWGYGALIMVNLFAFRATNPKIMMATRDPIGPNNNDQIRLNDNLASLTVCAWGTHGGYLNRQKDVLSMLQNPMCLAKTKHGLPRHPLYLKADLKPIPFSV